jgi:prepilin-type N-terminal cleavage/methylation domain-containing protein
MINQSKPQKGYGLIEMVIGLALAGILTTGITTFTVQTITESTRASNRMQATMQVENAGYWVSRDVQMAENLTLGADAGFPMQLLWVDSDLNQYQVSYNVTEGQIQRTLVKNDEEPVRTFIAQPVNPDPSLTNLSYAGGLLTFNVTSTYANRNVTRSYQIKKRLDLE